MLFFGGLMSVTQQKRKAISQTPSSNTSSGFGHFIKCNDNNSWRKISYDGLESTRMLDSSTQELLKAYTLELLNVLKK